MELQLPHHFQPRPYQLPLLRALDSGIKRAIQVWNRRSGKDKVDWNYMIRKAMEDVGAYYYFLPSYTQGKKVIWDNIDNDGFKMLEHIPRQLIKDINKSELKVELINGSFIQLIAADTFDKTSVGTNPKGVVFSEYSLSNPIVWDYVRPILMVNGGWAIFNFTPRGMNHAWKLLQIANENPHEWFTEILTIEDTQVITPEQYEAEIRQGMPRDLAEQEFYCKFIEGASAVFHNIDECVRPTQSFSSGLQSNRRYQMGIDLAKHQDYTVITIIDLHTFDVIKQLEFNKIDWPEQKEIIVKEVKYWNKARTWIDSTGIGDPICADLKRLISLEEFKFTETSREQLLNNLKIMLEQKKITLPDDKELIDQLKSMQYEMVGSKVKMRVPDGLHDDRIMSLALSVWGLYERLPLAAVRKLKKEIQLEQGIRVRMTSY